MGKWFLIFLTTLALKSYAQVHTADLETNENLFVQTYLYRESSKITLVDTLKDGYWLIFEDKQHKILSVKGQYVNKSKNGEFCFFKYGKNGLYLYKIENYKNGKLEGDFISFHPNGKIHTRCTYSEDKIIGYYEVYDVEGVLIKRIILDNESLEGFDNIY